MKTMLMMLVMLAGLAALVPGMMVAGMRLGRRVAANATEAGAVFGPVAYFALNGATVESVTVSAATAPAGSVLTTWRPLGSIKSATPQIGRQGGQKIRAYDTTLGKFTTVNKVNEQIDLSYQFVLQEVDDLIIALANAADGVDGSDEYVPMGTDAKVRGYLLFRQYEGTTKVNEVKVWGDLLVVSGPVSQEAPGDVTVRFEVISNSNNAGVTAGGLAG